MFCLDQHLCKERCGSRSGSTFIWKLRQEIAWGGCDITTSDTWRYVWIFGRKPGTTEHGPSETLGHVRLSTVTQERTRLMGRRVVITKTLVGKSGRPWHIYLIFDLLSLVGRMHVHRRFILWKRSVRWMELHRWVDDDCWWCHNAYIE